MKATLIFFRLSLPVLLGGGWTPTAWAATAVPSGSPVAPVGTGTGVGGFGVAEPEAADAVGLAAAAAGGTAALGVVAGAADGGGGGAADGATLGATDGAALAAAAGTDVPPAEAAGAVVGAAGFAV